MIWIYDNAIADDLNESIQGEIPIVKVAGSELLPALIAQKQNDEITYPMIGLTRHQDTPIDTDRTNFTRMHKGVVSVMDTDTNEIYHEQCIPIKLGYDLTIITTNQADADELMREILFKYTQMYFIVTELPYEAKRKVRFGVSIDFQTNITQKSGVVAALSEGTLYEVVIPLKCDGCVLVNYRPVKLGRQVISNSIVCE